MKKPAFTLIELIIVMGIILTFVGLAVVDFRGSKQEQETVQMVEEVRALLQQSRARVYAGQTVDGRFVCEGAYFEQGQRAQHVSMPVNDEGECEVSGAQLSAYGMQQGDPAVSFVSSVVGGAHLLYVPPSADLQAYSSNGDLFERELLVRFANEDGEDRFKLETSLKENHFDLSSVENEE